MADARIGLVLTVVFGASAGCQPMFQGTPIGRAHDDNGWMLIDPWLNVVPLGSDPGGTLLPSVRSIVREDFLDEAPWWARVSPRGRYVLIVRYVPGGGFMSRTDSFRVVDVCQRTVQKVAAPDALGIYRYEMAWSPDEKSLVCFSSWHRDPNELFWRTGHFYLLRRDGEDGPWSWQKLAGIPKVWGESHSSVLTAGSWESPTTFLFATGVPDVQKDLSRPAPHHVYRYDVTTSQVMRLREGLSPVSLGRDRFLYRQYPHWMTWMRLATETTSWGSSKCDELINCSTGIPAVSPDRRFVIFRYSKLTSFLGHAAIDESASGYDARDDAYCRSIGSYQAMDRIRHSVWIAAPRELRKAVQR